MEEMKIFLIYDKINNVTLFHKYYFIFIKTVVQEQSFYLILISFCSRSTLLLN
ncbi:hypothetical protein H312_03329 [Anncaliia algerae PRA339]|uniref:Uncharacterized protein n=1 Tax=Anncaliia algerae PRA339 TaxID=1288291 RepID=A0A059EX23_9MICR|nr:hypothetical protein H312_03329 [Anncaliia algerae PRA339]